MIYVAYAANANAFNKNPPIKNNTISLSLNTFAQCMCIHLESSQVKSSQVKSSQVTFIYIALLTIQIVSKQLHNIKTGIFLS